ncbi:glycosyl transferase, group 1 [Rhizobium favelukesii]|uniref:Glycosyl transferase, group 1 n=1 Tax=Rhizobium favelukesii TaxID=348824 RepID=W6RC08_9HYPH|nr:glycosyl transferase, group 1 [Rhizobium favelukesii]
MRHHARRLHRCLWPPHAEQPDLQCGPRCSAGRTGRAEGPQASRDRHAQQSPPRERVDTFLDLARQARNESLPIRAILAGPAGASERAAIDAAAAELGDTLDYRGPLYDAAKSAFYREVDVFVFATTHGNEAQPLEIFEAKAAGNAVISFDRGCIRKQLDESDLLIPSGGEFVPTALAWLSAMSPEPALETRRKAIQQAYKTRHAKARAAINSLLNFDE